MMLATSPADPLRFPRAELFRSQVALQTVGEATTGSFPWTERHVQAVWYDDRLRPRELKSATGETVWVENPGRWNLEAGPDFLGAVLFAGRERRRIEGDVEIHLSPADWIRHGHTDDPRYRQVRAHVTWFPGAVDESLFPPGTVHLALAPWCTVDLEDVDVSAYPYAEPRARSPLVRPEAMDPDQLGAFLEGAGEERLRRKVVRMQRLMQKRGREQVVYEETAAALGYQHNKTPFRLLAQSLPLTALHAQYGTDSSVMYAVMAGMSGLLPRQPEARWPGEAKTELRRVWDLWWREAHRWEEAGALDASRWCRTGMRPLNHPLRRMAALAQWVAGGLFKRICGADSIAEVDLCRFEPCFWSERCGWGGVKRHAELVGRDRARAILLNAVVPARLACGEDCLAEALPVEPLSGKAREAATLLFGPDHSPSLYRSALARQGLLLLHEEFVLTGKPLPWQLTPSRVL